MQSFERALASRLTRHAPASRLTPHDSGLVAALRLVSRACALRRLACGARRRASSSRARRSHAFARPRGKVHPATPPAYVHGMPTAAASPHQRRRTLACTTLPLAHPDVARFPCTLSRALVQKHKNTTFYSLHHDPLPALRRVRSSRIRPSRIRLPHSCSSPSLGDRRCSPVILAESKTLINIVKVRRAYRPPICPPI